jgi:macrolide transport system ATP-binding/permease protein
MAQMGAFGSNILFMNGAPPAPRAPSGHIRLSDVRALADLPQVRTIMAATTLKAQVRYGNRDMTSTIGGYSPVFPKIFSWPLTAGSFFTDADMTSAAAVAVIGSEVQKKLFVDGRDPVGQYILIENVPFQVIGVLASKGSSGANQRNDLRIAIPYTAARIRLSGAEYPEYVVIGAADSTLVHEAEQAIRSLMLRLHNGVADFEIDNSAALIQAEAHTRNGLSLMLGAIAAISLLVGGIGVMNVMLMTVRERTREIGIRIATGARQRDILRQFLTEAVVLSLVGGLIGIALALLIGSALTLADVAVAFSSLAMLGAFACSVATGVIFGFMPARKAAGLDPVAALTSE